MEKQEIEDMLEKLGVPIVKSKGLKPLTEEELDELRNMLSQTNFVDIIDNREA